MSVSAQDTDGPWPRTIDVASGRITIYQPQPESMTGNKLAARAAVSYTENGAEPIFGAVWVDAMVDTDKDSRLASLMSLKVTNVKFPAEEDTARIAKFKSLLETEAPKWNLEISLDRLVASLEVTAMEKSLSEGLKNDPPEILYYDTPSFLVLIDGEPKIQKDDQLGMERVINSPYAIVKNKDGMFYLFASSKWFVSSSVTGEWTYASIPPKNIKALEKKLRPDGDGAGEELDGPVPSIVVSTTPAELIQSSGKAEFKPIQNTNLLYMVNSDNDIFMDISSQHYFVLISGRWYQSPRLKGKWEFVAADKLPEDFKKIPEGSEKDNVLASVAGTNAARDAIAEAQIPQTAKVDRKKASTKVTYDGEPKFETIEGTTLAYAVNTASTVLRSSGKYYAVEDGVWFESSSANGPWAVSTSRPEDVEKIPASCPVYNVKYVYIYDVTPDYIYMGYTPGYLGCYVYGPTVVYGTGWYYPAWYGAYYYPRPVTWGFSMNYNPWTGWSFGVSFYSGFYMGFGGGWWGPPVYLPPFRPPYGHYYGGRPVVIHNTNININNNRTNNIYNHRNDVVTRDINRGDIQARDRARNTSDMNRAATRPAEKPAATQGNRLPNNVQADRDGNIYQHDNGQWQQRQNKDWKPAAQDRELNDLNRLQQTRDRGATRTGSYQQMNRGAGMGGGMNMGGARMGGGFRGR